MDITPLCLRGEASLSLAKIASITACGEVWPFPPALEAGARWFESNQADQLECSVGSGPTVMGNPDQQLA